MNEKEKFKQFLEEYNSLTNFLKNNIKETTFGDMPQPENLDAEIEKDLDNAIRKLAADFALLSTTYQIIINENGNKEAFHEYVNILLHPENYSTSAIRANAKKAVFYRHLKNYQKKAAAIEHYQKEHSETGISKNQFAKKYHEEYGVSEKTLRNNWLQGID